MRFLIVSLILLLARTACAAPTGNVLSTPPPAPTFVPVKPTSAPADTVSESLAPANPATFETSLLATEWKGGSEGNLLFPVDPASGAALPGYTPISLGQGYSYAFSPDRRILAVASFPNDHAYNGSLLLIDLPSWKTQPFDLKLKGWVRTMVFSPDGKRLAIAHGEPIYKVTIFDLEQGTIAAQVETTPFVTKMDFTAGGDALMLYGTSINKADGLSGGPPQALLLDAKDLSTRWSAELDGLRDGLFPKNEKATPDNIHAPGQAMYLSPGLAFAPDRDALYIVHADAGELTTVDFSSQKIKTVKIQASLGWFERLLSLTAGVAHAKIADGTSKQAAISPDGQFLYVVGSSSVSSQDKFGNWQMEQTSLGLEIIQTSDGSRIEYIETDAFELSASPDGRFLYLRSWVKDAPWTEIFDTINRQSVARKEWIYASPALRMNGELLLVSTYSTSEYTHHMNVLQPDDLSLLSKWTGTNYMSWLTTP